LVIKLTEIYENNTSTTRLPGQAANGVKNYALRDVFVNPNHVVCLRPEVNMSRQIKEEKVVLTEGGVKNNQGFTRVYLDRGQTGIDIVVLGTPTQVESLFSEKTLLKG